MQCKAKSKRTQQRCRAHASPGMAVCRHHGGRSLKGEAHPNYKDGRYSTNLPRKLTQRYLAARSDADLVSVRDEVAIAETRIAELLNRLEQGDLGELWPKLSKAKDEFSSARAVRDLARMQRSMAVMEQLIDCGSRDWLLWRDIGTHLDRISKLRQQEHRRLIDLESMISIDRAHEMLDFMIACVMAAMQKYIEDKHVIRAIYLEVSEGFSRHLGHGSLAREEIDA